jgi:hypothetical protein
MSYADFEYRIYFFSPASIPLHYFSLAYAPLRFNCFPLLGLQMRTYRRNQLNSEGINANLYTLIHDYIYKEFLSQWKAKGKFKLRWKLTEVKRHSACERDDYI